MKEGNKLDYELMSQEQIDTELKKTSEVIPSKKQDVKVLNYELQKEDEEETSEIYVMSKVNFHASRKHHYE